MTTQDETPRSGGHAAVVRAGAALADVTAGSLSRAGESAPFCRTSRKIADQERGFLAGPPARFWSDQRGHATAGTVAADTIERGDR